MLIRMSEIILEEVEFFTKQIMTEPSVSLKYYSIVFLRLNSIWTPLCFKARYNSWALMPSVASSLSHCSLHFKDGRNYSEWICNKAASQFEVTQCYNLRNHLEKMAW